jgi:hypothetical protein
MKMAFTQRTHSPLSALDRAPVWLNSEPLTAAGLPGFDVLVNFWTYSCVNWLRTLPYVTSEFGGRVAYGVQALTSVPGRATAGGACHTAAIAHSDYCPAVPNSSCHFVLKNVTKSFFGVRYWSFGGRLSLVTRA